MKTKWIGEHDKCDICGRKTIDFPYFVDGKLKNNSVWGLMCPLCFAEHGCGVGSGLAQLYDSKTLDIIDITYSKCFKRAFDFVIDHEGQYVCDPDDPGGATKFGISQTSYPDLDIANLTFEDAKNIYYNDYWNKCHCAKLPEYIAIMVFDQSVNQGTHAAIITLQKALGVKADGIIGPITIESMNKLHKPPGIIGCEVLVKITCERLKYYYNITRLNKKLEKFINGWINRTVECFGYCTSIYYETEKIYH